jgi:hypothetical protein
MLVDVQYCHISSGQCVEPYKVTTPKCDTCFSLVTWEGVVQKNYRQGD